MSPDRGSGARTASLDSDGDQIPDVYELTHPPLNGLDAADAGADTVSLLRGQSTALISSTRPAKLSSGRPPRFLSIELAAAFDALEQALARARPPVILVSSEVGWGIVPDNALARRFRDEAGRLHQRLAGRAERVVLVVAGLPMVAGSRLDRKSVV